jgi:lipopolysaccharide assembly protein A
MTTEPQPAQAPAPAPQPDASQPGPGPQPQPQPGPQPSTPPPDHKIRHTRISGLWIAVAIFAVVLLFLLIFILQNNRDVSISYLGVNGRLPLGVALLLAAVCGVLLAILAGAARMAQLHSVARKHRRADAQRKPAQR